MISDKDMETLVECFRRSEGNGWEPQNPRHPFFDRMIEAGYLRRSDGRCGFERFKDSHIVFTDAGREAITARLAVQA